MKPRRNRECFEITTNYPTLLIFILFLSSCAKQEYHYIPQPKQLGFIEKTENFVFDQMDQHKIDEFKLFLEEFINAPFLRVKFYYSPKTPVAFRQKMQHLLLKNGLKPKKIDFYKDVYLRSFLKVDLITYTAILPICPDWSSPIPSTKENKKLSNLGCTQQTNLGLMLEDPYDLKESSSLTPGIASEKIDVFNDKKIQSREIENVWSDSKSFTK
ncbi:MAG: CpaD family pilus assembly lipoprotein [Alphaproteobacteria bacterium]|nr:CpaD family pilus assembly lipoprotein [Alphaproteobacteria bacterium]